MNPPRLLDQLRSKIRTLHYSIRTEESYADWVKRFVRFHRLQHPSKLGKEHINQFLSHLAVVNKVAASTQNHAQSVLKLSSRQEECHVTFTSFSTGTFTFPIHATTFRYRGRLFASM